MNLRNSLQGWRSVSCLVVLLAAGSIGWLGHAAGVPVLLEAVSSNDQVKVDLSWQADQARQYDVLTTTNVAGTNWWLATPSPIQPTNLVGHWSLLSTNSAQFFRLAQRDMQGPDIIARYPATNGIAVGRFATLTVAVTDETGVDTNAFALTVKGLTLTNGSPGVTVSPSQFQYVPGTNAWGDYGGTGTVAFVCADLRSNVTMSSWRFGLEVQPVVTNVLLHLPPPTPGRHAALMSAAKRHGVTYLQGLTIVSFETNCIIFNYSGEGHGLYMGGILVSHDPARRFYRQITGLAEDAANHLVTAYATDVPLTTLVKDGSFSPEVFEPAAGAHVGTHWEVELGYTIPFAYKTEFSVLPMEFGHVRVTPVNLTLDLEGSAQVACVLKNWRVAALDASVAAELAAELRFSVEFFERVDLLDKKTTLAAVPLGYAVGFVGPVPVWVELQLGIDLGFEASAEAALAFETGVDAYASTDFRLTWGPDGWDHSYSGSFDAVPVPLDDGFEVSAEAFLYLKPRLSVLVYSLAGVTADYRRGADLEAKWEPGDPQCEITLYDKSSINAAMTILGVPDDKLPNLTLVDQKRALQTWYWPPIQEQAPVFTRHPSDVTAAAGETVTLEASATGNPEPTYQWLQNGVAIPSQTQPTLTFTMRDVTVGSYYVIAKNRLGWVRSNPATVSLAAAPPSDTHSPPGMVWIPPGTFTMGSPDSEQGRDPDEGPQTRVTLTHGFWMGRYEVTVAEYKAVMKDTWCTSSPNCPVDRVNWYDANRYCANLTVAERASGRLPAGYVYRLPTEAEWEYACRAGTTTRFYYGDDPGYTQLGDYAWYWLNTWSGTEPVGQKLPNGWGLHDMYGNVWELCLDWYGAYPGGSVTDPTGPAWDWGWYRVVRGGSWSLGGQYCRSAYRRFLVSPEIRHSTIGFRAVLATGQP